MADSIKRHVFFLDDEPEVRDVVRETLEESGIEVSSFDSPMECLAQLRSHRCDLLITDLKMPQKNGIELLGDVKRLAPWVPVLMITGYGDVPTAVKAIKGGAVDFIEKPLAKESFVRKVKSVLRQYAPPGTRLRRSLTRAEGRILKWIIAGKSNKEMATLLNRSVRTIEVHRASVMRKLGVDSVVDLVRRATTVGLTDQNEESPGKTKDEGKDEPDSEIQRDTCRGS